MQLARHGKLTRAEVTRLFGVSGNTATTLMKQLLAEGAIEKVMPTASPRTHYFRLRAPPDSANGS
jgi:Fic family protein